MDRVSDLSLQVAYQSYSFVQRQGGSILYFLLYFACVKSKLSSRMWFVSQGLNNNTARSECVGTSIRSQEVGGWIADRITGGWSLSLPPSVTISIMSITFSSYGWTCTFVYPFIHMLKCFFPLSFCINTPSVTKSAELWTSEGRDRSSSERKEKMTHFH